MTDAVILSAVRTPIGRFGGALSTSAAVWCLVAVAALAALALREAPALRRRALE